MSATEAKRTFTFDFNDDHCHHDPDTLLTGASPRVLTEVERHRGNQKLRDYDPYDWGVLADHLEACSETVDDDDAAEEFLTATQTIRDELHSEGCDCAEHEHEWFKEAVEKAIEDLTGVLLFVGYTADSDSRADIVNDADIADAAPSYQDLVDVFAGHGYDSVEVSIDVETGALACSFATDTGGCNAVIHAIRDPLVVELLDVINTEGTPGGCRFLEVADVTVTPALVKAVRALMSSPALHTFSYPFTQRMREFTAEIRDVEAFHATAAFGQTGVFTLTEMDLDAVAQLAPHWELTLGEMLAVLRAAV